MAAVRTHLSFDRIVIAILVLVVIGQAGLPVLLARAEDEPGPRAVLPASFTYQGRFEQNGVPVTGTYDFEFSLYDVASGGSPVATLPALTAVPVSNGLFTVQLSFPASQFQGEQRWVNVRVRPNAQTAFTQLARQELTATPYALYAKSVAMAGDGTATTAAHSDHTHLGQSWSSGSFFSGLQITSTNQAVGSVGIRGITTGILAAGIKGEAPNGGIAVGGDATYTENGDLAIGVLGRTCEPGDCLFEEHIHDGSGVYGESTAGNGVVGVTRPGGGYAGVLGVGTDGVAGYGDQAGVRGISANTGVYGQTTGSFGWGVYSQGNMYTSGTLTQASDERLKTDTAASAGLAEILALRSHSYRWLLPDMDDGKRHQGLFAQEVLEVLPDIVTYVEGPESSNYAVAYTELIPVLIKAIQEQQAQIDALRANR